MPNSFFIDTGFGSNVVPAVGGLVNTIQQQRAAQQRQQHETGLANIAFGQDQQIAQQRQDYQNELLDKKFAREDEVSAQEKAKEAADKITDQKNRNIAAELIKSGSTEDIAEFLAANPEYKKNIEAGLGFKNEATKKNAADTAFRILSGEDPREVLKDRAAFVVSQGGDPKDTLAAFGDTPEERERGARLLLAQYGTSEQIKAIDKLYPSKSSATVGAQEILEDGTIIQSTSAGPVVYDPEGNKVTGKAASEAVEKARAQEISNARQKSGEKKRATLEAEKDLKAEVEAGVVSAKAGAKASVKAFERLEGINSSISNIDDAIRLIDEGAETGAVASRLPSVRAASIKLDNLQNRLGLDVIGSTTFGALSQGELDLALNTALPKNLEGPDLKEWLIEKKAAQEKLSDYVEAAAIFLGVPGNTPADWIKEQKRKRTKSRGGSNGLSSAASKYLIGN